MRRDSPVELDPRAEEEARAAFLWYLERNERAAAAFEGEVESAVTQIGDAPTMYPIVEGELRRFLRRCAPTRDRMSAIGYRISVERVIRSAGIPNSWGSLGVSPRSTHCR
jgi:plasmid stabilization system protein ParE